mmetsp:Transcript_1878/g.4778  ORF Transcript_1878/g.4778 Transcript_1878/m.4778 type:complete len:201 (+) Transcript_1878:143-745(+)
MGSLPCCVADDTPQPKGAVSTAYADEFSGVNHVQVAGSMISDPAERREETHTLPPPYYHQAPALSEGPVEEMKPDADLVSKGAAEPLIASQPQIDTTESITRIESQLGGEGYVELHVVRGGIEERLGLDLKHCKTHLLVKNIQEGDTADLYNKAQIDPKRRLEYGDTIWKVNDVEKSDVDMIKECRENLHLTIHVKKATK